MSLQQCESIQTSCTLGLVESQEKLSLHTSFSWTPVLGQGKVPMGETWVRLERSSSSVQFEDAWLPKSPGRGRNHMAPWLGCSSQTCCLLWVGSLRVTPCLKAQAAAERVCYLLNPAAAVWAGSCHVRPCGSSWAGRCSGCSFALK